GFVAGRRHELQTLSPDTVYMPYGTSLRMGPLGYQSDAQSTLAVSYNSLDGYAASLQEALTRPWPAYEAIGIRNPGGDYNQLATSLLQIENEFYGTIRPKRVIYPGERPLHALRERGVEYVEVRLMDLDPFVPVGIAAQTMRFLDVFLLHCLLSDSPPDTPQEIAALARNQHRTAARGREPGLRLERGGHEVGLAEWGAELLDAHLPIAASLDAVHGGTRYTEAVRAAGAGLREPASLPSARVLAAIGSEFDNSFTGFVDARSLHTRRTLLELPWTDAAQARFEAMAHRSVEDQKQIEAADTMDFEDYRAQYVSPARLGFSSDWGDAAAAPAAAAAAPVA
ncbi:MAG: gshA2, partial [Variovorax sp.]|nr:gshA2 [Variovorax sp.]